MNRIKKITEIPLKERSVLIKKVLEQTDYSVKQAQELLKEHGVTAGERTLRTHKSKLLKTSVNKPRINLNLSDTKKQVNPLEILTDLSNRKRYLSKTKDIADISINVKHPIAIMLGADWHFGGLDVDYVSLKKHVEFLFNTPNFYLITAGDDINLMTMMNRNVSARAEAMTPEEQVAYLEAFINKCVKEEKILACGWGNHDDEWMEKNAGFSIVKYLTKNKVPYFEAQAYINLKVGSQYYPIMFTHKTRFNSYMNPVHGNKRMQQMQTELFGTEVKPARIILTAHTHNPYYAVEGCLPEDRVILVKTGTFKTKDLY